MGEFLAAMAQHKAASAAAGGGGGGGDSAGTGLAQLAQMMHQGDALAQPAQPAAPQPGFSDPGLQPQNAMAQPSTNFMDQITAARQAPVDFRNDMRAKLYGALAHVL